MEELTPKIKRGYLKSRGWHRQDRAVGANQSLELWYANEKHPLHYQRGVSLTSAWRHQMDYELKHDKP